jgi:chemotaxis protein MotA
VKVLVGLLIVICSVIGGYIAMGGHIHVLMQPFEFVIILGAAVGAFVIGNPSEVISHLGKSFGTIFGGNKLGKDENMELLCFIFTILKIARTKGLLSLESHVEKPSESSIFLQFPKLLAHPRYIAFICDYLRMFSMGSENAYQLEDLMNEEIEAFEHSESEPVHALATMADGLPALGIVAAVLGVIHTMGAISQPPEVLGKLIGAALVGTFAGVLFSYGFIGPMASYLKVIVAGRVKFMHTIKFGLISYLHGNAPILAVEQARKGVDEHYRPSFVELEERIQQLGEISA